MGDVEPPRPSPRERSLAAERAALRRRRASVVLGSIGLAALFAGGIAIVILPAAIVPLTLLMAVGVVLLIVAFFLARGQMGASLRALGK